MVISASFNDITDDDEPCDCTGCPHCDPGPDGACQASTASLDSYDGHCPGCADHTSP